jgi:cholesterol oxidase
MQMLSQYDVVVIGSGFGGAITAMRLVQAGRSVCVLERGRRWSPNDFPRTLVQVRDHGLWRDGHSHGPIEYRVFKNMDVIQGAGVGGGSLHYFNVHLRTPTEIFERPEWPNAVNRELMEPYYDIVQDMMESKPLDLGERLGKVSPKTVLFQEAAAAMGRQAELVPVAVHTGDVGHNRQGLGQAPCDFGADCLLGCRIGAKNTLDRNYIPAGEKLGLHVFPLHPVTAIEPTDAGYRVSFSRLSPEDPSHRGEPGAVIGKRVIVAAGSLGSTEVLLKSRAWLPNLSKALGRYFSGNGDMLFAGAIKTSKQAEPGQGLPITIGGNFSKPGSKHRVFIEDLGFPNPFMWMLEMKLPSLSQIASELEAAGSYIRNTLHLSHEHSALMFESEKVFGGARFDRFLPYLGMGTDARDGLLQLKDGQLDLHWDNEKSAEMFEEMMDAMKELSNRAGGEFLPSFLWAAGKRLLTAHPLGGCVMSDSPDTGVVNDRGEVYGHPGLYVCDGAIIPGPLSVNPSLTIGATAERVAYCMINGHELAGNAPSPTNTRAAYS